VQADRVQIRSTPIGPNGGGSRVTVIDSSRGVVLEVHRYDAQGKLIATAKLSKHVQDPLSKAILPRRVEIRWPSNQFEVSLDLPDLQVNRLTSEAQPFFIPPPLPGYRRIDLADPNLQPGQPPIGAQPNGLQPGAAPMAMPPHPNRLQL
jgi:hypothetical protein